MNIVKELRKKAGIQQKELAIIIGVSRPTVSDWEANKKDPSGDRLKKLAEYFGVDELVILGKGVADLTKPASNEPRTPEARILAAWADSATEEQRKKAIKFMDLLFETNLLNFKENNDDDTKL